MSEIAGDQLRSIVERIERLDEEIAALNSDKKDVYSEAKGNGLDVGVIKEIIKIRRKDPAELSEREVLLDLYMRALDGTPVATRVQVYEGRP